MADQIVNEYELDLNKFKTQMSLIEDRLSDIEKAAKKSGKGLGDSFNQQDGIINKLRADIKRLGDERDKSNDPKAIKAYNKELEKSNKELQKFVATQKESSDMSGKLGKALIAAFSVGAVINLGKQMFEVTAQFQKFEAVLTNTLGSNTAAQIALQEISDFASKTPFGVAELTEAFVKLANQGFTPTQVEMRKLGDLAASTGKSFDQLTEAIIDAQTGEFERLKEFGVRASKEGDKVTFTFKGVQKQVDFTSESIRNYVLSLGDAAGVSGAMESISKTLGGQVSNLGDNWDRLLLVLGDQTEGVLAGTIALLNDLLETLIELNSSFSDITLKLLSKEKELLQQITDQELENLEKQRQEELKNLELQQEGLKARLVLQQQLYNRALELDPSEVGTETRQEEINQRAEILQQTKDQVSEQEKALKFKTQELDLIQNEFNRRQKILEAIKQQNKLSQEEIDKQFKAKLDFLQKEEQLVLRGLKVTDATNEGLIQAQIDFNNRRLELLRQYGKQDTQDYQSLVLRKVELEKELTKEREKQNKEQLNNYRKSRNDEVAQAEQTKGQLTDIYNQIADEYEKAEARKKKATELLTNFVAEAAQGLNNLLFEFGLSRLEEDQQQAKEQADSRISEIDRQLDQGLISEELAAGRKAQIEENLAKKEAEIKRKQAIADKLKSIFDIAIDTAAGAVKAVAASPLTFGQPFLSFILATGALNAGLVAAKPIPKFKDGVIGFKGKGTDTSDDNIVAISNNESILTAHKTRKYKGELTAIHEDRFDDYINKNYVLPAVKSAIERSEKRNNKSSRTEALLEKIALNQSDNAHLERLTRQNNSVAIKNTKELAREMARQSNIGRGIR